MRIVVKVGTSTLAHSTGRLNIRHTEDLVKVLSDLKNAGHEVILVSSGAIGMGVGKLSLPQRPKDMATKQACAAVGQCELMYTYDRLFTAYNHNVAQVLLTGVDVEDAGRRQNVENTLNRLLELGALPIINENDTVATDEITSIGDNDTLAAIVCRCIHADLLVLLSDIDGLYTANPHTHPEARLLPLVERITPEILALADGVGSSLGTGGMSTKLRAAQLVTELGADMVIANGSHPELLYDIAEGRPVGTRFAGRKEGRTMTTQEILEAARAAKSALALADEQTRKQALWGMADWLCHPDQMQAILAANAEDMAAARGHISDVMLDRLALTPKRIGAMARGILEVASLPDPVGAVLKRIERPNGLVIEKTAVPMGVIAIIYESRPNVTSDAAALAIKSGNVCVLRCGREAWRSAHAIVEALRRGLKENGLPEAAVSLIEDTTHASANALMAAVGFVDLLIPRGGAGLIRACVENAKVPCIQTGTGICHVFVDDSADQTQALDIIENAKASRPSVCNAEEVCLVHSAIAAEFLPKLARRLGPARVARGLHPVELRLDERAAAVIDGTPAGPKDFDIEFLDYILAVKVVDSVEEAIGHIAEHSTGHSEAILTRNEAHAALFTAAVDSAAVYVNCSTRFTDGGEFGLGCEMGISTQKLHARGPMGLQELCSYKYIIHGDGQVR